ncbi:MAG: dTDP-glucose 4,6-dehydratase [Myxococcales bacterium]|nr:dTDP-glucose 4,6-dehydratase [Myxococcales bacterium]
MTPRPRRLSSLGPSQSVLVTGGAGFMGSAFIRHLLAAPSLTARVVNLDALTYAAGPEHLAALAPQRYCFVEGDIRDFALVSDLVTRHDVRLIVNFAAETHVDRSLHEAGPFIGTNVVGTQTLLDVLRRHPAVHLHHISTDEVFGPWTEDRPCPESAPYRPQSPYAASKAAADHLVRAAAHSHDLSVTLTHATNNYGPRQFPEKLVPLTILRCRDGGPIPIYGDGRQSRDWLHVDDHARAVHTVLETGERGQSHNVSAREERRNLELVARILDAYAAITSTSRADLDALITHVADRPGHDRRYALDPSRLEALGWRSEVPLAAGLEATVRWYLDHPAWLEAVTHEGYQTWIRAHYGSSTSRLK